MDVDDLLKLVNASDDVHINYIKLMYIIRILNEMKVCRIENMSEYEGENIFRFDVYFNASKANIEKSSILKKLKSQCRDRTKF